MLIAIIYFQKKLNKHDGILFSRDVLEMSTQEEGTPKISAHILPTDQTVQMADNYFYGCYQKCEANEATCTVACGANICKPSDFQCNANVSKFLSPMYQIEGNNLDVFVDKILDPKQYKLFKEGKAYVPQKYVYDRLSTDSNSFIKQFSFLDNTHSPSLDQMMTYIPNDKACVKMTPCIDIAASTGVCCGAPPKYKDAPPIASPIMPPTSSSQNKPPIMPPTSSYQDNPPIIPTRYQDNPTSSYQDNPFSSSHQDNPFSSSHQDDSMIFSNDDDHVTIPSPTQSIVDVVQNMIDYATNDPENAINKVGNVVNNMIDSIINDPEKAMNQAGDMVNSAKSDIGKALLQNGNDNNIALQTVNLIEKITSSTPTQSSKTTKQQLFTFNGTFYFTMVQIVLLVILVTAFIILSRKN